MAMTDPSPAIASRDLEESSSDTNRETNGSPELPELCRSLAERARAAARGLALATGADKNGWLQDSAALLRRRGDEILAANVRDVAAAPARGLTDAAIDRLTLSTARLEDIARALEEVAGLPDPIGELVTSSRRPNGLEVVQTRVPLGVIFMIYESRPNVTADAAALCVKSGNAVILRGGSEAFHTNQAIHSVLAQALGARSLPPDAVQLVPTTQRAAVGELLKLGELIDLAIPRGGESLIRRVVAEATMPVLKHYLGNCHVYVDASADLEMALAITLNAKVQRPGVCNAAEKLLVHREVAQSFLPRVCGELIAAGVELRGDPATRELVAACRPATEQDWYTEYADKILAVKIVDSLESAIDHITKYGSSHTEAIITSDLAAARRFVARVDSSAVMVNASTRFNDGGQLGLGAEIGISTDKFHARGPCGLRELTTTKWIVYGDGQIRQ